MDIITVQLDITLVEAIKDLEEIMVTVAAMQVDDRDAGASRAEAQEAQEVLEALEEAAMIRGSSASTTTSSSTIRSPYPLTTSSVEARAASGGA